MCFHMCPIHWSVLMYMCQSWIKDRGCPPDTVLEPAFLKGRETDVSLDRSEVRGSEAAKQREAIITAMLTKRNEEVVCCEVLVDPLISQIWSRLHKYIEYNLKYEVHETNYLHGLLLCEKGVATCTYNPRSQCFIRSAEILDYSSHFRCFDNMLSGLRFGLRLNKLILCGFFFFLFFLSQGIFLWPFRPASEGRTLPGQTTSTRTPTCMLSQVSNWWCDS